MRTNAEFFLYYHQSEFIQKLIKDKQNLEAKAFTLTFRYIGDDLSINNPHFVNWIPLIYLKELASIKTASCAPFLDIYLIYEVNGQQSTRDNDRRDEFNFAILFATPWPPSSMESIFHNSYATLELGVYI